MWKIEGIPASAGITIGRVMHIQECTHSFERVVSPEAIQQEKERFLEAQKVALLQLDKLQKHTAETVGQHQSEVFAAHKLMVEDPSLVDSVFEEMDTNCASAEAAVEVSTDAIASMFASLDDEYMRERAADVKDIGKRLLCILQGKTEEVKYEGILVAQDLLPSDTASIDFATVSGFITALGGKTSHSSILARAAGLSAVVGVSTSLLMEIWSLWTAM